MKDTAQKFFVMEAGKSFFSEAVEIFENWVADKVVLFEDLPVVSLDGMIMMKEKLGRKKDLEDIHLINEWRNTNVHRQGGLTSTSVCSMIKS